MTSLPWSPSLSHTHRAAVDWPGLPVLGPLLDLRRDELGMFLRMGAASDAVRFTIFGKPLHLLTHPDHMRHVLVENAKNYGKQTRGYKALRSVVGNGLLTSEGETWLKQRRLAQPAFHRKQIESFAETMVRCTEDAADEWTHERVVDFSKEMMRLTLRIVTITLLSRDARGEADAVGRSLTVGLEHVIHRMNTPWALPESFPTPANLKFRRAQSQLEAVVDATIAERRAHGPREEGDGDLLDMLMWSPDEQGNVMGDAPLRDEVMTIMLAGHETTAMALTWTMWLLTQHPEIEAALRSEIDAVLGGRAPTLADLPRLGLAERVIHESLRLYPPAWVIARSAIGDDDVCGHPVKAGDWLFLSPWVTHRHPEFWPSPDRFDPDRFLPEKVAARHRHAWIPFSTGQRKCIGDQFALMEAKLLLVTVLQRARFTARPGQTVALEPLVTLRPKGGLPLTLTPITRTAAEPAAPTGDPGAGAANAPPAGGCPFHH